MNETSARSSLRRHCAKPVGTKSCKSVKRSASPRAALGVLEIADGRAISIVDTCEDVDDVSVDAKRKRAYVSCGQGYVDVFEASGTTYQRISRVPTAAGARTSLFAPELDRLIVAVRESSAGPAAVWIFKPVP